MELEALMRQNVMHTTGQRLGSKRTNPFMKYLRKYWILYLFVIPTILWFIVFRYFPMPGVYMAFTRYKGIGSIYEAKFVGLKWFESFFNSAYAAQTLKNTMRLSLYSLCTFPLPIIFALIVNEIRSEKFKKVSQTVVYAPHFISLVVMVGMLQLFFGRYGLVNNLAENLGFERYSYFLESAAFRPLYILSSNWQDFGWSAIIYIAALANVDPQQHEAAILDGATRWQRVIHIDLPAIMPMVSVMLIMSIGGLMGVGYEKALLMHTDGNLAVSELIATYVYKRGLTGVPDQAYATAIGLFNSVINVILLIIANTTSKKFSENSLW